MEIWNKTGEKMYQIYNYTVHTHTVLFLSLGKKKNNINTHKKDLILWLLAHEVIYIKHIKK